MIVSAEWLYSCNKEVVILDARHDLMDEDKGRRSYEKEHIPGALFIDMASEMSDRSLNHGGRYPMPSITRIANIFSSKGINENTEVVIYDGNSGGMAAARAWWMLSYIGNNHAAILDGGFEDWKNKGYPTTNEIPEQTTVHFQPSVNHSFIVKAEDVYERIEEAILIDARSADRFLGENELLDAQAGHIPGALNYFWKGVLTETGKWKTEAELQHHFKDVSKEKELIVYCGSGISACPNVMALLKAGYTNVKLYPGSWSDWITHDHYPVAKGK
ncbi:sulfurtransferase [Shouchella patagoniensis]|uniref:sulfurtransferase n=1 Tax=Shouchella patagoniensis TaxID=228576 RepID=UPI0014741F03|nr:sulfurtransferase [Shouchella patagoniensis]